MYTLGMLLSYSDYGQQQAPSGGMLVFELIVGVIGIIAQWKIFTKAGQPGWACLIR